MVVSNQLKNQHLLWRAGFGPLCKDFNQLEKTSQKSLFKSILKSSSKSPDYINVASNELSDLVMMPMAEGA
ncbi:MAG: DUF1800 domain-containing protein, partial [Bacteroidota bacterium]